MARLLRRALAVCAGAAAVAAGAPTAHASANTGAPASASAETIVTLQLVGSEMCLDLSGVAENGAKAIQWTCDGTDTQQWRMIPVDNSSFELRSMRSGRCLEVENSGTQIGAAVQVWDCTGGKQMRWQTALVDFANKSYEFRVTHTSERCLDINNGGFLNGVRTNGVGAQSWSCNQSDAQLWQIKAVK
ncbi:RICIN domain-containing protein [Streptomyces sp. TLI_146]|uniref:RICIN domain-containing protein n=1 Tax=Streptomyces sp. TLI_146 TaxID=1938858 RepID=UPI000C70982F|nr:RICIN domain-containing protein [Streptomyces sp. TLI_146]PKV89888.1 ricin-type beta-trefoil lectin protein [Streptomyces sp. TLI_146]